jgi:hyperosmotically inducible periplasmic protein
MNIRQLSLIALSSLVLAAASGCAVMRDQSTVGAYIDDTAITTAVKARHAESKDINTASISVETLNGTVMLSGFAKDRNEMQRAETLARRVDGVKDVKNQIVVRP